MIWRARPHSFMRGGPFFADSPLIEVASTLCGRTLSLPRPVSFPSTAPLVQCYYEAVQLPASARTACLFRKIHRSAAIGSKVDAFLCRRDRLGCSLLECLIFNGVWPS